MNIRKATVEDVPTLIAMGREMIAESPVFSKFTPDEKKQELIFTKAVESTTVCVFVTDDLTGMFVGHLEEQPWFKEIIAVEDILFVKKEFRKTSRAIGLLNQFETWIKEKQIKHISMGISTGVELEASTRFYERMGFKQSGILFRKEI